jgi:hypothetical protein
MKQLFLLWCFFSATVFSQVLPPNAPERQQLIAMGYTIDKEDEKATFNLVRLGKTRIILSKNDEKLSVSRIFTREKKLTQSDEYELMKIINSFNDKFPYQFVLDESLTANLYIFGSHDPKTFAYVMRLIDRVDVVFNSDPNFYKLINN